MTAFRKVLLPTNFTEVAAHAACYVRGLVEEHGGTLYVLHVSEPVVPPATPDLVTGMLVLPAHDADLARRLDAFVQTHFSGLRTPIVTELRTGEPADVICEYAHELGADLIVLGTHARGLARRLLLGSVSKDVLERAGCAVLLVPRSARLWGESSGELVTSGRRQGAF